MHIALYVHTAPLVIFYGMETIDIAPKHRWIGSPESDHAAFNWMANYCNGFRVDSWFAPSQWETSLQSNAVSHWLVPVPGGFPSQRPVTRSFGFSLKFSFGWVKNREAGDLRRHCAHNDVTVMFFLRFCTMDMAETECQILFPNTDTGESCYGANFVFGGGTEACHNDDFRCCQWRQSWHHGNSRFLILVKNRQNLTSTFQPL